MKSFGAPLSSHTQPIVIGFLSTLWTVLNVVSNHFTVFLKQWINFRMVAENDRGFRTPGERQTTSLFIRVHLLHTKKRKTKCAAKASYSCPAIISRRPGSQNTSKESQLNSEKDSRRKQARSHVTLEIYKPFE